MVLVCCPVNNEQTERMRLPRCCTTWDARLIELIFGTAHESVLCRTLAQLSVFRGVYVCPVWGASLLIHVMIALYAAWIYPRVREPKLTGASANSRIRLASREILSTSACGSCHVIPRSRTHLQVSTIELHFDFVIAQIARVTRRIAKRVLRMQFSADFVNRLFDRPVFIGP